MITPFVANILVRFSPKLGLGLYGVVTIGAAVCALLLEVETAGMALQE